MANNGNGGPPPHVKEKLNNLPIGPGQNRGNGRGPQQGRKLGVERTIAGTQRQIGAGQAFGVSRAKNTDEYAYRIEAPGGGFYTVDERSTRLPSSALTVGESQMYVRETASEHIVEIAYKHDVSGNNGNGNGKGNGNGNGNGNGSGSGDETQDFEMLYDAVGSFNSTGV